MALEESTHQEETFHDGCGIESLNSIQQTNGLHNRLFLHRLAVSHRQGLFQGIVDRQQSHGRYDCTTNGHTEVAQGAGGQHSAQARTDDHADAHNAADGAKDDALLLARRQIRHIGLRHRVIATGYTVQNSGPRDHQQW